MTKEELRKKYIQIRKDIKNKKEQSLSITNELIRKDYFINAKTIALYSSLEDEVDTTMLINMCILLDKQICLPKIINDKEMDFYLITDTEELKEGPLKILEPTTDEVVDRNDIDLMIMPGICFDKNNNRIGYGRGYYDTYLAKPHHFPKVALAFNEQITDEEIETSPNDIKVDEVVLPLKM